MIENNATGQVFRERCEDCNKLKEKGSMYIGEGTVSAVNGESVYKTGVLPPPKNTGNYILTANVVNKDDGSTEADVKWVKPFVVLDPSSLGTTELVKETIYFVKAESGS